MNDKKDFTRNKLDRLLRPRSIALVGASSNSGSLGESVITNLEDAGYAGDLYLINPKRPIVHGRQCLGSIDELPDGVDCAVLAIPGTAVLDSARACARKGIGGLIVFSAGFAEAGETGREAQRELTSIARDYDIALEGPNCLGMVNYLEGVPLTFVSTPPQEQIRIPGAAILSQSGALAAVLAVNMLHHRIPLTYSISTGNEAAIGVEDFFEHLIEGESTRVFALVVEQFRQPKRLLDLARRARKLGKFVVLLHPGRSKAAQASAATHTGAIAGDYEVMHALVTDAGVIHVESLEEFVDVSQILVRCSEFTGGGAAVFTESGAFKALTLDLCERVGLELPLLSVKAEAALREALPVFVPPSNPLDLTAQGLVDPTLYRRTLPAVLEEDSFGSVLLAIILTDSKTTRLKLPPIVDAIRRLKPTKPVVFAALDEGAPFDFPELTELRQLGVACFPSAERAIAALARVTSLRPLQAERQVRIANQSLTARSMLKGVIPEYRSKAIVREIGISVVVGKLAKNLEDAIEIAHNIGFPLVLKAQAAELPHKTEAGCVQLGIESEQELSKAWAVLHENVKTYKPDLDLDGVLVEQMAPPGLELIIGARRDAQWGPVLLIGSGGVFAEGVRDARVLPPEMTRREIQEELRKLRCGSLFGGYRGMPALDIEAAADAVYRLSGLIQSSPEITEIDINPLVVYPKGVIALDALICACDRHL